MTGGGEQLGGAEVRFEAVDATAGAMQSAERNVRMWGESAQQIIRRVTTAQEKYEQRVAGAQTAFEQGKITQTELTRAIASYNDELQRGQPLTEAAKRQAAAFTESHNRAQQVIAGLETATEKYHRELAELKTLEAQGLLTSKQRAAATHNLTQAYMKQQLVTQRAAQSEKGNNVEKMRAARITRTVETAEDAYARQLREVEMLHKKGHITLQTYTRMQTHLAAELKRTQGAMGAGRHGAGKFNNALQQASYGVQDFTQVYGQTGLAGALRASVNNWSQVLAVINPLAGAIGGVAVTLGGIWLANWASSNDELEKQADKLSKVKSGIDRVREAYEQLSEAIDFEQTAKGLSGGAEARKEEESKKLEIKKAAAELKAATSARFRQATDLGITDAALGMEGHGVGAGVTAADLGPNVRSTLAMAHRRFATKKMEGYGEEYLEKWKNRPDIGMDIVKSRREGLRETPEEYGFPKLTDEQKEALSAMDAEVRAKAERLAKLREQGDKLRKRTSEEQAGDLAVTLKEKRDRVEKDREERLKKVADLREKAEKKAMGLKGSMASDADPSRVTNLMNKFLQRQDEINTLFGSGGRLHDPARQAEFGALNKKATAAKLDALIKEPKEKSKTAAFQDIAALGKQIQLASLDKEDKFKKEQLDALKEIVKNTKKQLDKYPGAILN